MILTGSDMPPAYVAAHVDRLAGSTVDRPFVMSSTDPWEATMSSRTYRISELVGTSPDGIDQAIRNGVERASKTLRHVDWFEVTQVRGHVIDGVVDHFQVSLKIGFRLEDDE